MLPHIVTETNDPLDTSTPARSVEDNGHEQTRNQTSAGQGDDPTHVDPGYHAPVDTPPCTVTETDTDGSTTDALGGRDRKLQLSGHDDGSSSTEFHGETTRGGMQGDLVAERAHNVVTVRPETDDNTGTTKGENPSGDRNLGADLTSLPDKVDGSVGTDGIRDVVGTVGKRGGSGSEDLEEGVSVLGCRESVDA